MPVICFSCLIALARTASTVLNKHGNSGEPYFVPELRGQIFCFSLLRMMLALGLSFIRPFLYWGAFLLHLICWGSLSWNDVFLLTTFSAFIEVIIGFFSPFILLLWCITFIDLHIFSHPCNPRGESRLIMADDPSVCCWVQFGGLVLRSFSSAFIRDIGLCCSCLVVSLYGFGFRIKLAL